MEHHDGIRTQDYKLIRIYNDIDEWELYDMKKNPREMTNVFDRPEYAQVQKEMIELLRKTQEDYKDYDPDEKETELFQGDRRLIEDRHK